MVGEISVGKTIRLLQVTYPPVMLNGVKHLKTPTLCVQILRAAQDDRTKGEQKEGSRTVWGRRRSMGEMNGKMTGGRVKKVGHCLLISLIICIFEVIHYHYHHTLKNHCL